MRLGAPCLGGLSLLASVWLSPASAQQQGPDIGAIWDDFAISNSLASKCAKPDGDKLAKFLLNFQIVSTHLSKRLSEKSPEWTSAKVDEAMKSRYSEIDAKMSEIVAKETCEGPRVKATLKRFDVQAGMDLMGKPKSN